MSDSDWAFQVGDRIEERQELRISIGEEEIKSGEYTVETRLQSVDTGDRYYYVENNFGHTHLYAAGAIEDTYRAVDTGSDRSGGGR